MSGETEANVSAWTIDSLHVHVQALLTYEVTALRDLLEERDRRYQERFDSQEKAVQERIAQVREETRLALQASEKAILKAEAASEKRFESVNEFRAQQADIISTFSRKEEVDSRFAGLVEKIEACLAQVIQLSGSTMPRNEYDRAHVDLADKVIGGDRAMGEKMEALAKSIDQRINQLQAQLSNIEAITR